MGHYRSMAALQQKRSDNNHQIRLQDVFLNHCRREQVEVSIQLLDQSHKNGQIIGFDHQSIILETEGRQYLVYKNAIVAVNPKQTVNYIFNDAYRQGGSDPGPEYTTDLA